MAELARAAARRIAAVGLVRFLIAVLPANIHAARSGVTLGGATATPMLPRIALQLLFIALVWWAGWRHAGQTARSGADRAHTAGAHP